METLVFNKPAKSVYKAAKAEFQKRGTAIKTTGKNKGSSQWVTRPTELGEKKYNQRSRFTVEVKPEGKSKSTARVYYESQSDISGKWGNVNRGRVPAQEYYILQRVNPTRAQEIDKRASAE